MRSCLHGWCLIGLGLAAFGCGSRGYDGSQRFPLSGVVSYDGEAIDAGTISFIPMEGDKQRVSGDMITDGKYTIPEAQGANAGKYRVEIRWAKKTGKQRRDSELDMMVDIRDEGLPPKFHNQSELTAEVSPQQTVFNFDLKSK